MPQPLRRLRRWPARLWRRARSTKVPADERRCAIRQPRHSGLGWRWRDSKSHNELARVVLDQAGQPRPVVARRLCVAAHRDPRAVTALIALLKEPNSCARVCCQGTWRDERPHGSRCAGFAHQRSRPSRRHPEAVRSLARLGSAALVTPLLTMARTNTTEPHLRLEIVTALGSMRTARSSTRSSICSAIPIPRFVRR